jgi:hypothetical protein
LAPPRSRCWARLPRARWPIEVPSKVTASRRWAGRRDRLCTAVWSYRPAIPSARTVGCRSSSRWSLIGSGEDGTPSPGQDRNRKRRRQTAGPHLRMTAGARRRWPVRRPRAASPLQACRSACRRQTSSPERPDLSPPQLPCPPVQPRLPGSASRASSEVSGKAALPGAVMTRLRIERTTVAREARTGGIEAVMLRPSLQLRRNAGAQGPAATLAGVPEAGHQRKERA